MSSKKSKQSMNLLDTTPKENNKISSIISIIFNLLILSYVIRLEDKLCGCIRDWRHDFIKYFSITLIAFVSLMFLIDDKYNNNILLKLFKGFLMVSSLINFYCLYTYVGDLDNTKCQCAIEKQKLLHIFLYYYRYIMLFSLILVIVSIIALNFLML